ncbi:unnamed protein product [Ectocarpus sp. 12 AP-2014]
MLVELKREERQEGRCRGLLPRRGCVSRSLSPSTKVINRRPFDSKTSVSSLNSTWPKRRTEASQNNSRESVEQTVARNTG